MKSRLEIYIESLEAKLEEYADEEQRGEENGDAEQCYTAQGKKELIQEIVPELRSLLGSPDPERPENQARNLKREKPTFRPIPEYGDLMTLAEFRELVTSGMIIDEDGSGNYSNGEVMFDLGVNLYDVEENQVKPRYTHVVWFNK